MRLLKMLTFTGLVIAAIAVVAESGYIVILKNGTMIQCREPIRIEGQNALITLATGTLASYPLALVDLIETERYNQLGLGDALLVEELTVGTPLPTPTPRQSLGEIATFRLGQTPELGSSVPPTPTPTPGIKLQGIAYHETRVDRAFTQIFDDRSLYLYRTSAGTQQDYYFVQTITDSQREVFKALKIVSEAFAVIHELHSDVAPGAVELEMVQTSGKAAGTFRITPKMATDLVSGELGVEQFYVKHVIF